jgi:hypothetical protein
LHRRSIRDWVYIGLFGALWGGVEISLGSLLHMLFPPLTGTFFTGLILGSTGCIIALTGSGFVPGRGTVLRIGVITALLKLIGPGGVKIGPIVAILAESLLMEAGLLLGRSPRIKKSPEQPVEEHALHKGTHRKSLFPYITAGMLCLTWNLPHRFIMLRILFGKRFIEVAVKMAKDGRVFGMRPDAVLLVIAVLLIIRIAAGAVSGYTAWRLGRTIRRRSLPYEEKE